MQPFNLIRFKSDRELADSVAAKWLAVIGAWNGVRYGVALSGGRIAGSLFTALAGLARGTPGILEKVHWFWGDERCVPPGDPESNFGLAERLLLGPLSIPESQIYRVRGEEPPAAAASNAERDLRGFAPGNAQGQPILDLIFLGMGEDGHVASLFPEEPESMVGNLAVFRHVVGAKPPPNRITLGYQAIAAARDVWVLASGGGKEKALTESLRAEGQTPLARVIKLRSQTTIFTELPVG